MKDIMIVPFGPTRPAPEGRRWCFACDGSEIDDTDDDGNPCKVCKGKRRWNTNDIAEYHRTHPEICRQSCGERHVNPFESPPGISKD